MLKLTKSGYVSRSEYYDWSIVISTTLIGTTVYVIPLFPIGYYLDKNDYVENTNKKTNHNILYNSYLPGIIGCLVVGIGLNNI